MLDDMEKNEAQQRYDDLQRVIEEAQQEAEALKGSAGLMIEQERLTPASHGSLNGQTKRKKIGTLVGNITFYVLLISVVLGITFFGLRAPDAPPRSIAGFSMMTVLSRSMEPTLPVRALVVTRRVDARTLEVGQIVTYLREGDTTVTHRIIEVIDNYQGSQQRAFRLQGDNNSTPDAEAVLAHNIIGEVIYSNLFLGQVVFFVQGHILPIVLFLILLILLSYVIKKFFFQPTTWHEETPVD